MIEKRFSWEYSYYDSTGEIYDWKRKECLLTDYLQKYEIEEWCQELNKIVDENEQLKKENNELKKQLRREETDKKRLMSYLMRYKGFGFDEIVDDYFNESYYDTWWEDGFYERCWDDYLRKRF